MIASLTANDYEYVTEPGQAEIIIVNTCGFIDDAKKESIETILGFKKKYPRAKVIMAGCLSERYGSTLKKELSEVDGFVGTSGPADIVRTVSSSVDGRSQADTKSPCDPKAIGRTRFLSYPGSAYVKISEGCNNGCSYCAIPIIRGSLRSRDIADIAGEIRALYANGISEINLVAQDCGSFGKDGNGPGIASLLESISGVEGDFWVRLLYIHPDRFPYGVLDVMARDPRVLPYFDIPFQHASARVLSRMGRSGSAAAYLDLIRSIRDANGLAVIRSTFLVGFPGETDEDFAELEDFQKNARLDWAGVFCYSREEGTAAYGFKGRVPKSLAASRKQRLEENQTGITERSLDRFVGREVRVLVEEEVKGECLYLCRAFIHAPEIDGLVVLKGEGLVPGTLVNARITKRNGIDLEAEVIR